MFNIEGYSFNTLTELNEFLVSAAESYYNEGEYIISDDVFDTMSAYYEEKSGKIFQVGASVKVGRTTDLSHSYTDFAGTLKKVKSVEEFITWYKKANSAIRSKINKNIYLSLKADGHSITVETKYVKGKTVIDKALTRGKDGKGKDLTSIFKKYEKFLDLPKVGQDYAIGFEAVITTENFEKFISDHGELYKSPRSMIGGVMSEDGSKYFEYLSFIALRIKTATGSLSRAEQIQICNKYNEDNVGIEDYFEVLDIDELSDVYSFTTDSRFELGIMCDGLVLEFIDEASRTNLGYSSTAPNFAVALKFPPAASETKVIDIEWSVEGNSSRHTPMVLFEPVKIVGITYKRVSLANYERFMSLQLRKGDKVLFTRNNDVMGYISPMQHVDNTKNKNSIIKPITKCISCSSDLVVDGAFLVCSSYACPLNELGNILQFFEKLDIKFIGRKTIEKLYEEDIISYFYEFFEMNNSSFEKIKSIDGLGDSVVKLIKTMVSTLKKEGVLDYKFMAGFNLPLLGRDRWKLIFQEISFAEFTKIVEEDIYKLPQKIINISGIGEATTEQIVNAFKVGGTKYDEYVETMMSVKVISSKTNKSYLVNENALSFCITGSAHPFETRDQIEDFIQSKGHKLVSGVSKKTSYLITNDTTSGTSKNQKANDLGIPILTVQEMKDMLENK